MKQFYLMLLVLGIYLSAPVAAQNSSRYLLSPDLRLSNFTATTILPKYYVSVGNVDINNYLNFTAGNLVIGDPSENIRDLVKSRLYLGLNTEVSANVFSVLWKSKKGGRSAFGASVRGYADVSLDRDFLQIATEGILPEGFGTDVVESRGIEINAHVYNELYYHKVKNLGKTNFGYRIRLVNPMVGVQVLTPSFRLVRENSSAENSISLNYEFLYGYYGANPLDLGSFNPSPGILTSPSASLLFDLGMEQEVNSKLKLGVSIQNIPGFFRVRNAELTRISGNVSFSGVGFIIGSDSLSTIFNDLLSFNVDTLIPKVEQFVGDMRVVVRPQLRIYAHRYLSEETFVSLTTTVNPSPSNPNMWTSIYLYSRPNKLFHVSYGLNWWTNSNVVSPSVAGRMLLAPYTRLTLSMSNPFVLPRVSPTGAVLIPENFNGFTVGLGVSMGLYRDEAF